MTPVKTTSRFNYSHTAIVCFVANFFQAVGCVFPLFLVPVRELYGITYTQFGLLVGLNFVTQVTSDVLFSKPVDRYGFRPFAVGGPICCSAGLVLYALSPVLMPGSVFVGFALGTFLFAAGGGLEELLLSPILDALPLPQDKKARSMSLLHSTYAWGQIFIVLVTTLLLAVTGPTGWQVILLGWAVVPLVMAALFAVVPMCPRVAPGREMRVKQLFKSRVFVLALVVLVFGGAAEVTMAQWASAFIERGLALPKLAGDTLGVCGYALMLAIGRTLYGLKGTRGGLYKMMILGSAGAVVTYLVAALSPAPVVGLVACGLTGLCVSMLWPGGVIIAGRHLPLAGASMFALLSASGDVGVAGASFITGRVADLVQSIPFLNATGEEAGLRAGLAVAALFAVGSLVACVALYRAAKAEEAAGALE